MDALPGDVVRMIGLELLASTDDLRDVVRWCATRSAARSALLPELEDLTRRATHPGDPPRSSWMLENYWEPMRRAVRGVVREMRAADRSRLTWVIGDRVGCVRGLVEEVLASEGMTRAGPPPIEWFLQMRKHWPKNRWILWKDPGGLEDALVIPDVTLEDLGSHDLTWVLLENLGLTHRLKVILVSECQVMMKEPHEEACLYNYNLPNTPVVCTYGTRVHLHRGQTCSGSGLPIACWPVGFKPGTVPYPSVDGTPSA